jgi:hypothetical protein
MTATPLIPTNPPHARQPVAPAVNDRGLRQVQRNHVGSTRPDPQPSDSGPLNPDEQARVTARRDGAGSADAILRHLRSL